MNNLDLIDFEKETVNVDEFSRTQAGLAELRKRFSKFPDPSESEENYEFVKKGVRELTGLRTSIEKKRKELKQPFIDAGRIIDSHAKVIISELQSLEEPMKEAKKEVDEKAKREKEQRIARLQKKIDDIKWLERDARGKASPYIIELIEQVENVEPADFYELREEAMKVRNDVLDNLGAALSERLEYERTAEQRAKEQKAREEAERKAHFQERINKAKMLPLQFMDKSADQVQQMIDKLESAEYSQDEWGEFRDEAQMAGAEALKQLVMMRDQKRLLEKSQPAQEPEQEACEEEKPVPEEKSSDDNFAKAVAALMLHCDMSDDYAEFVVEEIQLGNIPHVMFVK